MIINSIVIFNVGLTGFSEIRKLTANVEAILLGVIIPLCQRNSGRLEEADREVWMDKVELPYSCMLRCVHPSCGTLFSCFSYFHAFTGAHEIPVFVYSFLITLFVGYLFQALWFPLLETVMAPQRKCKDTTSAYFVGEKDVFNCVCYFAVYKRELCNKRRFRYCFVSHFYAW